MTEYVIVPSEPTNEMAANMRYTANFGNGNELIFEALLNPRETFHADLSAAPKHNLVAVDKGELEGMKREIDKYKSTLDEIAFSGMSIPLALGDSPESNARFYKDRAYSFITLAAQALAPFKETQK